MQADGQVISICKNHTHAHHGSVYAPVSTDRFASVICDLSSLRHVIQLYLNRPPAYFAATGISNNATWNQLVYVAVLVHLAAVV